MTVVGQDPRTTVLREASEELRIETDPREANKVRWFARDDPTQWAHDRFDPHMARFRDKLLARPGTQVLVG